MKKNSFAKKLVRFLMLIIILFCINLGISFLIYLGAHQQTIKDFGRSLIYLGCLYLLFGVWSVLGNLKHRTNVDFVVNRSLSNGRTEGYVSPLEKSFKFMLYSILIGGLTLSMGVVLFQ